MFSECSSLRSIIINNFNTSKVINMSYMFNKCSSLESLNLSNFDTLKVLDMSYMIQDCYKIKQLDLSKFDTSNVINMTNMFGKCKKLIDLNISQFSINDITRVKNMFLNCSYDLKEKMKKQFKTINENAFKDEDVDFACNYFERSVFDDPFDIYFFNDRHDRLFDLNEEESI